MHEETMHLHEHSIDLQHAMLKTLVSWKLTMCYIAAVLTLSLVLRIMGVN